MERSEAKATSARVPAKQLPGSIRVMRVREVRSRRLRTRLMKRRTSRMNQSSWWVSRKASYARTAVELPSVRKTNWPISGSLKRRWRMASSSSRAQDRGQKVSVASMVGGTGVDGPRIVRFAIRRARSTSTVTDGYSTRSSVRVRSRGVSSTPVALSGRSERVAIAWARSRTRSCHRDFGATSSTSRQSTAFLPRTPSSRVLNTSAKSRRTFRLSMIRVRPPVPGRTASSGVSGKDTEELRSSISMM